MNKIYTFLFLLIFFISKSESQCVITCNQNVGVFSNNDPNTIGYDNMTSSFHSSIASEEFGFRVWGERMLNNGTGHALSPLYINSTNYPALTGTVYFAGVGSSSINNVQLIVLTSTGLFASGAPGIVLSTTIKGTAPFQKVTVDGKTDGLPIGITPDSVKMMFVTNQTIIITTCGGRVFVLSQVTNVRGDFGIGISTKWSQVLMSNGQPLTGIVAARGNTGFAFALKNDNTLWTWGNSVQLGNGSAPFNSNAAVSMTLPTGVSKIKMIQATSSNGPASYYVLDTSNRVFALGRNNVGQLADNTSVDKSVWVNCVYSTGALVTDAKWITSNEHDPLYPNIGILNKNSQMRTAGHNSSFMIARTTNTGFNNLNFPTGISSTDTIYFCEVGGHTSAYIKKNTPRYGYVGHHVNGSIGNNDASNNLLTSVNFIIPPIISICGTVCDTPVISKKPFNCNDSIATFIIKGRRNNLVKFNINGVNDSLFIGNNDSAIISRVKPNGDLALNITQVNSVYCNLTLEIKDTLKLSTSKDSFLTICSNESVTFKQQTINTSGVYRDTLTNVLGCDSFFTLFLTVNNTSTKDSFLTICEPSTIIFDGKTINTSGIYKDTFINSLGCDSILTLNLTVNPIVSTIINQSICSGQSFLGKTATGTYIDTFKNGSSKGCDSIRTLNLTVNSKSFSTINQTICQGNSFLGKSISGTYIDTLIGANSKGCDSIRTLNLTVLPTSSSIFYQSICLGDTFMGKYTTGIYIDTFKNGSSTGCDSIRTLNLTVNHTQKPGISINPNPNCANKNTTISAVTPTGNYIYIWTVPNTLGAPGNVPSFTTNTPGTYKLSVKTKKSILCNTDFEYNQIISGTNFSITNQNNVPCWQTTAGDSMIEVWSNGFSGVPAFSGNQFVELNANMVSSLFQNFIANSGNQIEISFAHRGRSGTDVMSVEIGKVGGPFVNLGNFSATNTAWVYNSLTYTIPNTIADTNFTLRFTSVSSTGGITIGNFLDAIDIKLISCKSEDTTVELIINPTSDSTINQSICEGSSFLFNGINRTVSGTYLDTLVNAKGCDSILTLNLTVNPKTFGSFSQTICEGNSFLFNGINRTVSGTYLDTLVNAKGCDSIVTLNLTVNPKTFGSFSHTICEGSSFLFNGINRIVSGAYLDTLVNAKGCDSIVTLNLTVNPKTFGSFSQTICEGSSFLFNGINRTVSGTYLDTLINAKGCDSILTLNLTVNPKTFGTISQTICQGNSFLFNGINRTTSGTYLDTLVNAKGCDSILTLNLTVNPKTFGSFNQTICEGSSFLFNGINRTVSGAYLDTLINAKGCDSILTLNLTVNPKTFGSFNQTICEGSSFLFNGINRTVSGTYIDTMVNAKGCDSIVTLNLTVNPKTFGSFSQTICEGSSFLFNSINRTVSGAYLDTLVNAKGCDSILTLNLTVNPKTFGTISQTICQGNSFLFNGINRTTSGTYLDTLVNTKGCDSILTLNLIVNPKTFSTINQTICEGSSFLGRSTSGTYIDTLFGANAKGCDSIRTLNLIVNPKTFGTINQTICQGNSFLFNGINRTVSGAYLDTLVNAKGCDSIVTLNLTVNPKTFGSFSQTICEGSSFLFNGINRTVSGAYLDTLVNAKGCDSIVTLNLTVNPKTFGSFSQTICEGSSFLFNGINRTISGAYLDTLVNAKGCDSILTLNLTVNPKTFGTISQTICQGNSFLFNGINRTTSGTYLDTLVNAKGCDSILTLNLIVNPKTFSTINQTICEGSSFLGRTTSGTYIDTLFGANAKGCDSIRTLNLIVNPKTFGTINQTICQGNSFLFNGINRTVSGAYLDTLINAKGCDSILTLNLTVNPKTIGSFSQTICEGSSFLFNGINRTVSGTYIDTMVNAKGCDSIVTLNLTVNPKTFGSFSQSICEGSSFLFNGINRTISGAYLDTLVNAKGCDSIVTLNLTVNPKTFGTISQTICQGNSFLFNGINRTISGTYLDTLVNAKGCDSILTLNLIVNPKTFSTINQTICEGSSFLGRTTSGTYIDTLFGANAKGCDSIRTLNLIVNPKTFGTINQTICQGNSFLFNGINRTISGTYLDTLVNAKGCDSIVSLNLTVNPKTFGSFNQTICEGSSILFNGINRTVSGAYLDTLVNAKGCDSIVTLNLTVNPKTFGSFSQTICEGSSFLFNGINRTVSGAYLDTLVNAKGCDSIVTLNLTVNPKTFGTISQTICQGNSFLFNGINRTTSGTYLDTLVNAKGCDSILTLNLIVNPKTFSTINQTICEGSSFLGRSTSGTYIDTLFGANAKGCDSIRTLNLIVNPKSFGTINQTICQGNSFLFNGINRTVSGAYLDTLVNAKGCDSILTLNLIVNPKTFSTINQTICEGSSFLGRTTSGTYIDTLFGANAKGCDSIRTLNLIVNPKTFGSFSQTICEGSSFLFNGINRTVSGAYLDTLVNDNGCDSILTLNLTVNMKTFDTINQTICEGDSFLFNGIKRTISGLYNDTLVNSKGCDSILTLRLKVNLTTYSTVIQTICEGQVYLARMSSGTFSDTFIGSNGCDSIRTLVLTVIPKTYSNFKETICEGKSFFNRTKTGIYSDTLVNVNGCDSIRTLHLTVNPISRTIINKTICLGDTFLRKFTTGNHLDTFTNQFGCDSIREINLIVLSPIRTVLNYEICEGENFRGHTQSGIYIDTFKNILGCDSIIETLDLYVRPNIDSSFKIRICEGTSYRGKTIAGKYIDSFQNNFGCNSIYRYELSLNPKTYSFETKSICFNQKYKGYSKTGIYKDTLTNQFGCDSIITLTLTVKSDFITKKLKDTVIKEGDTVLLQAQKGFLMYTWNTRATTSEILVFEKGKYKVTIMNHDGCVGYDSCNIYLNPNDTSGTDTTEIDSIDGYAECPNVFTPNDDYKNDLFKPNFYGRVEVVRLLIYTRLGEKVYEGHGNFSAWDGIYKGEKCEPGVYVYFIEYNNNKGKHFAKGSVTLIR